MVEADHIALRRHLRRRAPVIQVPSGRPSRRIEDEWDSAGEVDTQRYANVLCYLERGLADQVGEIARVLYLVAQVQGYGSFHVCSFVFGFPDGRLEHDGRSTWVQGKLSGKGMADKLCALSGAESGTDQPLIDRLFPPAVGAKTGVERGDLLLFFCRSRRVALTANAQAIYDRHRRHAVWIFLGAGDATWEAGTFVPGLVE